MAADGNESLVLKVLVLGEAGTGKTSIIKRYVYNVPPGRHKTTLGVDFHVKQLVIGDLIVKLQLWDIAGQDRFGAIARVYYKDAYGALLVYDASSPFVGEKVSEWKKAIDDNILLPNEKPLPVVLLGNKCEDADVDNAQMERYAQEKSFAKFFDTSAKDNINIEEAVRFLVEKILEHQDILQQKKAPKVTFALGATTKASNTSGCC